jgi:hypothetical protein
MAEREYQAAYKAATEAGAIAEAAHAAGAKARAEGEAVKLARALAAFEQSGGSVDMGAPEYGATLHSRRRL